MNNDVSNEFLKDIEKLIVEFGAKIDQINCVSKKLGAPDLNRYILIASEAKIHYEKVLSAYV